jgi:TAT (twin-arginine translocation) pathway signal sequence
MTVQRRDVLKGGVALGAIASLPTVALAQNGFAPVPGAWRTFEITTRLEIDEPRGRV